MKKVLVVGIIITVVVFILFIWNTNFQGMSFWDIKRVITIYGVLALVAGGVISGRTGGNILANMLIGTALFALLIALLTEWL